MWSFICGAAGCLLTSFGFARYLEERQRHERLLRWRTIVWPIRKSTFVRRQ